jgi:glycosyltransferase involved in cell wall biosynthesis
VDVLVICNQPPAFSFPGLKFIPWTEQSEVNDLLRVNIGIMPLQDDAWSEGKCGFKLIQYLALGIPAVASPVGVNRDIIQDGVNGFLCMTDEEWESALLLLMTHPEKREEMGSAGREKIKSSYSIQANADVFLSLFD